MELTDFNAVSTNFEKLGTNFTELGTNFSKVGTAFNKGEDGPTYEFVDLGLSVKWAKCNIGAEKETDYGMYFQFGDVIGHDAQDCNHYDPAPTVEVDSNNCLLPAYDAATQLMGAGYRMPTKEECEELVNSTDWDVVTIDGVSGMKFSKKGDSDTYIFIPFAGRCEYGEFNSVTDDAYLWTSTFAEWEDAYCFTCYYWDLAETGSYNCHQGSPVRAVCN